MALQRLSALQPGMEVARDILTPSGQCLLRAGTVLTEPLIALLASRALAGVEVESGRAAAPRLSEEERLALEREVDQALERKYLRAADNPRLAALRPVFRKWLIRRRAGA